MFFKPLLFTISRKDLSDIVSEEKFVEIYSFMKLIDPLTQIHLVQ